MERRTQLYGDVARTKCGCSEEYFYECANAKRDRLEPQLLRGNAVLSLALEESSLDLEVVIVVSPLEWNQGEIQELLQEHSCNIPRWGSTS